MDKSTFYDEDSIQSLSPKEHIQTRPSMYIGSTETPKGIITEILDNSLDEVGVGHADYITIEISKDNIVTIQDNGQGILTNTKREDGLTILEAAYGQVNTSAKFSNDGVYSGRSKGLHGVGSSITVFLSDWLEVESYNGGQSEFIRFENGDVVKRSSGKTNITGVKTKFKPSKKYFKNDKIDLNKFEDYLNNICGLMPQLTINFNGKEIRREEGIDYLVNKQIEKDIDLLENNHFIINDQIDNRSLSLVMTYTTKTNSYIKGFVNYGDTESGPHYTAIKSCLTRTINKWAKEQGLLKTQDKNLDGTSIQEGVIIIFNLNSPNIAYDSQSKERVSSNDFVPFLNELFTEKLEIFMDNHPSEMVTIIEKALLARRASEAAKKARAAVKNKKPQKNKKVKIMNPDKLKDAEYTGQDSTLLLVEGLSAGSSVSVARDPKKYGILMLRGKLINAFTNKQDKLLKNEEIQLLLKALNIDENNYDSSKLRYGRVAICVDQDSDGRHIGLLIMTALQHFCPQFISEGRLCWLRSPLYIVKHNGKEDYYFTDEELDKAKKNGLVSGEVQRCKGLGSLSAEQARDSMFTDKQKIDILEPDLNAICLLEELMGSKNEYRKEFVFNKIDFSQVRE